MVARTGIPATDWRHMDWQPRFRKTTRWRNEKIFKNRTRIPKESRSKKTQRSTGKHIMLSSRQLKACHFDWILFAIHAGWRWKEFYLGSIALYIIVNDHNRTERLASYQWVTWSEPRYSLEDMPNAQSSERNGPLFRAGDQCLQVVNSSSNNRNLIGWWRFRAVRWTIKTYEILIIWRSVYNHPFQKELDNKTYCKRGTTHHVGNSISSVLDYVWTWSYTRMGGAVFQMST